jgi:phosphate transport system permease protein
MAAPSTAPGARVPDPSEELLHRALSGEKLPRWAPAAAALAAAVLALLLAEFTAISGRAGTLLVGLALFVAIQTTWSFAVEGRRHAKDRLATTAVYASFVVAIVPLVAILVSVISEGLKTLSVSFLMHSMRNVGPREVGGGIYHALIGTLEQVGIAALFGIPLGILVAVYLVEYARGGKLARVISFFVDVMTGVPSIVAGLFIYTGFILTLGFERSGFAGSLALTILMIPVVVRSTEEMLKLVPNELRESAYALGVAKYRTILRIVLPTAISGIITGSMLAVARVAGETAPLLLTTFLSQSINPNPFAEPQASLPTFIWDQINTGTIASVARAWAAALTLILLILGLTLMARFFAYLNRTK